MESGAGRGGGWGLRMYATTTYARPCEEKELKGLESVVRYPRVGAQGSALLLVALPQYCQSIK